VLSIGKIAAGQHRYYEQQVAHGADDYYSGRGEAPGWWAGTGADALGLDGRVSGAEFNALIAGMDPRDPSVRLRSSGRDPKIAALDLTFSAPKSVSVLATLAPTRVREALVEAHDEAMGAALLYLEDRAVQVRRGVDSRVEAGEGLIAVAYRHRMSRALDPQMHTHVVAANMTRGPDGRFTALHGTPLYRHAKTAGFLYQAHLRAHVTERLGLEWGPVRNGAAELTAIPTDVLRGFSQRRHEMERAALAGGIGLGSKAAGQAAALATRERKQYGIDTHTWLEEVGARAGELGLGRDELEAIGRDATARLAKGVTVEPVDERALGDQLVGPAGLTERQNTFDERAVLQAFAEAAGQGATVDEVRDQADRFDGRADVLATVRDELTSADLVACEERLIAAAVGRADGRVAVVDSRTVDRVIAATPLQLTGQQAAVLRAVAASGRGVEVVEALAGTGKTTTAGAIRTLYEDVGCEVIGVAPTGRGARELTDQAGIQARTLDRMLIDLERLGDQLPKRCVIVLDEAGMAPTRTTARLLEHAQRANAKVIAIGDPAQLASVLAGGWLRAVGERVGAPGLTEVMRQRDPAERRALAALHERLPRPYLDWATSNRRIDTHASQRDACEQAVREWATAVGEVGVEQAVLIARDNDTRDMLNHAARDLRRDHGMLGHEQAFGPVDLAVGDRVICRHNDRLLDVDNGTRGTVRHVDPDRVVIETDSHLTRQLPAGYVAEHVEHAYALTGHGMQGATVERAIVVATPHDLTAGWSYTALTRARHHTHLLIHDHEPLTDHQRNEIAPSEPERAAGREDLLARVARRMSERDDQDLAIDQLPRAGHADDPQLALPLTTGPTQEDAAVRAEPVTEDVSRERLAALRARLEQLTAQRAALPVAHLQRLDDAEARVLKLTARREELRVQLERLPEPRRSLLGRTRDPDLVDRTRLTSALTGTRAQLEATLAERATLTRELGDPEQIRSELDALNRTITPIREQHRSLRYELAQRELANPAPWVARTFGERPARSQGNDWDNAVLRTAEYRLDHNITDPDTPLGPQPAGNHEPHHREQAQQTIEHYQHLLGHDHEHNIGIDIGLG
jgi:conjugative relaxase-like TrwC/TraI family protein